jgi:hypothetical protein
MANAKGHGIFLGPQVPALRTFYSRKNKNEQGRSPPKRIARHCQDSPRRLAYLSWNTTLLLVGMFSTDQPTKINEETPRLLDLIFHTNCDSCKKQKTIK